mgnify:CR=1 FL=1
MNKASQRGVAALPLIFVVIALLAAIGVGYVLIKQPFSEETNTNTTADVVVTNSNTAVTTNSTTNTNTVATNTNATVNSNTNTSVTSNIFSFDKVNVGDHVAGMTIAAKGQYRSGAAFPQNRKVVFSGHATLTGTYYKRGISGFTLEGLTEASLTQLPILDDETRTVWFSFANQSDVQAALGDLTTDGAGKLATVEIDEYTINVYPSEVGNSSKFLLGSLGSSLTAGSRFHMVCETARTLPIVAARKLALF